MRFWISILFLALATVSLSQSAVSDASKKVPVLILKDSVNVGMAATLERAIDESTQAGHPALLVLLDTPGGYLEATRDIVQKFLATQKIKILVWVGPEGARAASAGTMITMAAHFAAMAPATSIGAATPVSMSGEGLGGDPEKEKKDGKKGQGIKEKIFDSGPADSGAAMRNKVTNDTLSFVEGIAKERGRNIEWARKSVSEAASLTGEKAFDQGVIDGVFRDKEELWQGVLKKFPELPQSPEFFDFEVGLKEKILSFISNPNIAYALLALGTLGIYAEMTNPGIGIPGTVGAVSLILGAISMKIIPIRPGSIGLLVLGLILLAVEILTPLPTFGVAGVLGLVCIALSGIFLLDSAQSDLSISLGIWGPIFISMAAVMAYLGYAAVKAMNAKPVRQGHDALVDQEAIVVSVTADEKGRIQLHGGEIWTAEWDAPGSGEFKKGMKVLVTKQDGFRVWVQKRGDS